MDEKRKRNRDRNRHDFNWSDAPVAMTGHCHPESGRQQRGLKPPKSRPDASNHHWPDAARVWSILRSSSSLDRTHEHHLTKRRERIVSASDHFFTLLFTSYELTRRWTLESGAASGRPFLENLQCSFVLPVPNQVPTLIRPK